MRARTPARRGAVTARVLLGDPLPEEELLKTSGTALETVLKEEGLNMSALLDAGTPKKPVFAGATTRGGFQRLTSGVA